MKDQQIVFIIPYFGSLPPYFSIWLKSVEKNPSVNFLFITDNKLNYEMPQNIKILYWSFDQLVKYIQEKFDFTICIDRPYKLCDFKPTYGYVFQEYISEYNYWGNCDMDCVFGDIMQFLNPLFDEYDAIGMYGHMSLYKNNNHINTLFKEPGALFEYKNVFSNKEIYAFDETTGIKQILKYKNIKTYYILKFMADIWANHKNLVICHEKAYGIKNFKNQIFLWENGKVFQCYLENNSLYYKEFLYLHFQKKCPIPMKGIEDSFYIFHDRFIPRESNNMDNEMLIKQKKYNNKVYIEFENIKWLLKKLLIYTKNSKKQRKINNYKRKYQDMIYGEI